MKHLGRLVVRNGKIAGLFLPYGEDGLESGIYEISEVLGEVRLRRVGDPAMDTTRLNAIDIDGVYLHRAETSLTTEEYEQACKGEE